MHTVLHWPGWERAMRRRRCCGASSAGCSPNSGMLHCSSTTQTPPEFVWPPQNGKNTYTVQLTHPGGRVENRETTHNWVLWDRPLAPGAYSWRVKVAGATNDTSKPRRFTIAADAVPFVVPSGDKLVAQAGKATRPRTWSSDPTHPLTTGRAKRAIALRDLVSEVDNKMPAPVQPEPTATSIGANYEDTVAEQKRTLGAALAWAMTRDG